MITLQYNGNHVVIAQLNSTIVVSTFPGRYSPDAESDRCGYTKADIARLYKDAHEEAKCYDLIRTLLKSGTPRNTIKYAATILGPFDTLSNASPDQQFLASRWIGDSRDWNYCNLRQTLDFLEALSFELYGRHFLPPVIDTRELVQSTTFEFDDHGRDAVIIMGNRLIFEAGRVDDFYGESACRTCGKYFVRWPEDEDRYGCPIGSACTCRSVCAGCNDVVRTESLIYDGCCSPRCRDGADGRLTEHSLVFAKHRGKQRGPASRLAGVEVEVAGGGASPKPLNKWIRKWGAGCVYDGSIDNEGAEWAGMEIVTPPASGEKLVEILTELDAALSESEAKVNKSCGLNVHVDGGKLSWQAIENFCKLWILVEDEMFGLVAKSRRESHYCKPFRNHAARILGAKSIETGSHTVAMKKAFVRGLYGARVGRENKKLKEKKLHKYDDSRYAAVNLHSWVYRGTIEFRLHHGTTKMLAKVLPWVRICRAIVHYSASMTEAMYAGVLNAPEKLRFIMTYFKDLSTADWIPERMAQIANRAGTLEGGE